jgi:hypothetical protein
VEIDVRGPFELREGDVFILCSDGLHGVVKEEELLDVAKLPIDEAADEYLRRALDRGAPDNVTVIVARVEPATDADPVDAERFDDTQPVEPIDRSLFDETVRDSPEDAVTAPIVALADTVEKPAPTSIEDTVDTAPQPVLHEALPPTSGERAAQETHAPEHKSSPVLKWTLLVALVLGAAGAWLYWNWHEGLATPAHSSTR